MNSENLQYMGTNGIKVSFEEILRQIFSDAGKNGTFIKDSRYKYSADENTAGLRIYRKNPKRIKFYPCITISAGAYDASLTTLGDNMEEAGTQYDNGVPISESFTGQYAIPINLTVQTEDSTDDRELITDYLVQILRILARDQFAQYGFGMNKIAIAGESEDEDDAGHIIYSNVVTVDVYTDYTGIITPDAAKFINKVVIDVLGKTSPTSTPVPLHREPPF